MRGALKKRITIRLEKEYVKKLKKERRIIVNKIVKLYPELKPEKKKILEYINKQEQPSDTEKEEPNAKNEIVVEKILIDGETYYVRDNGSVYCIVEDGNVYAQVVGVMGDGKINLFKKRKIKS